LKGVDIDSLWRVPRDGGQETRVLEPVDREAFAVVKEGIYFIQKSDSDTRHLVRFFDFRTKNSRSICTIEGVIDIYLSASADGRWLLYSQIDQVGSDLMLVESLR
jgi:hypothetical protein